ncbi:site-specific integrase [Clostridium sporogenes]|uniref:site-specific integrase n=1 Tax=Clostridium sporogenes TaxID=1509 RepID=UPI002149E0B7|nr:site-specific integrase [Clostridium sporogenes]MCR1975019.1 site-specific integrase [Clostridium sporogenes]
MKIFLEYCSYKNLSNKTIKSYNQTLVLFMRYLKEEKDIIAINNLRLSDGAYRCYMSIWF